ncbi:MAG: hypothetical protein MHPSP_003058, partial [Paramarteilia canceri]
DCDENFNNEKNKLKSKQYAEEIISQMESNKMRKVTEKMDNEIMVEEHLKNFENKFLSEPIARPFNQISNINKVENSNVPLQQNLIDKKLKNENCGFDEFHFLKKELEMKKLKQEKKIRAKQNQEVNKNLAKSAQKNRDSEKTENNKKATYYPKFDDSQSIGNKRVIILILMDIYLESKDILKYFI